MAAASGPTISGRPDSVIARVLLAVCASLLLATGVQATPKALAFADGSNSTYSGRTLSAKLGDVVSVLDKGAVGDNVTDDCVAFTTALATGKSVLVPRVSGGAYRINCQLSIVTDGQEIVCESRATPILLYYSAGPEIVVGAAGSSSTKNIAIRNCTITSKQAGGAMVFVRYVRGFRVFDCTITADQFLKLGDSSLGTSKGAYIVELYRDEMVRTAGATLPYVNLENFGGQWLIDSSFYEGASRSGTSGWRCNDNIQPRSDDNRWFNTYWSRDDINIEMVDCRATNVQMLGLHSEGALTYPIKVEITSSTAKDVGSVGFGGMIIDGARLDGVNEAIYVKSARAGTDMSVLSIAHIQQTGGAATKGAIWIEASAGLVQQVTIDDVRGLTSPVANSDWIMVRGGDASKTIDSVLVDNIGGLSRTATLLRSQLRVEGTADGEVRAGYNILGTGASARFSDTSGVLSHP